MDKQLEEAFNRIFLSTPEGRLNYLLGAKREMERWKVHPADIEARIEAIKKERGWE